MTPPNPNYIRISISGPAGAGKGTVSDILREQEKLTTYAFADPLKDLICSQLGVSKEEFDQMKNDVEGNPGLAEKARTLIQTIGDGFRIWDKEHWIKQAKAELAFREEEGYSNGVIVTDARHVNEAMTLRKAGFFMVYIDCPEEFKRLPGNTKAHLTETALLPWVNNTLDRNYKGDERFDLYIMNDRVTGIDAIVSAIRMYYMRQRGMGGMPFEPTQ